METSGKQSWHLHTSKTTVQEHTNAFQRDRRDTEHYEIDNKAFHAIVARLAMAKNPNQIMATRQLDEITRPGSDHYHYKPLEEVYANFDRHAGNKYVDATRGTIGVHNMKVENKYPTLHATKPIDTSYLPNKLIFKPLKMDTGI